MGHTLFNLFICWFVFKKKKYQVSFFSWRFLPGNLCLLWSGEQDASGALC